MNPYEVLGVPETAKEDRIRRAYRRRAMEVHPDRGGDQAEFHAVQLAYRTLSDDARRAHYDATGEVRPEVPDNSRQATVAVLAQALDAVLNQTMTSGRSPREEPLLEGMKSQIRQVIASAEDSLKKLDEAGVILADVASRVTETEGQWLAGILEQQVRQVEAQRIPIREALAAHRAALEHLGGCEYRCDPRKAPGASWTGISTATGQAIFFKGTVS